MSEEKAHLLTSTPLSPLIFPSRNNISAGNQYGSVFKTGAGRLAHQWRKVIFWVIFLSAAAFILFKSNRGLTSREGAGEVEGNLSGRLVTAKQHVASFVRSVESNYKLQTPPTLNHGVNDTWVVITSINEPTNAIKLLAANPDLKVVVVGDLKSPKTYEWPNVIFLSVDQQKKLGYKMLDHTPYKHYARKNIGYLYAIQNGAKVIYETDDDNEMSVDLHETFIFSTEATESATANQAAAFKEILTFENHPEISALLVCNPYAHFGEETIWPRGYPLSNIGDEPCSRYIKGKSVLPSIQQGLANGDPDVDAIFRLTRKSKSKAIQVTFNGKAEPVAYPKGLFSPFNSQNTLFFHEAFPLLLIPKTTTFRVCDIWRGYWAQRLLWDIGGQLVFLKPSVEQIRNAHHYLSDFIDEIDLYKDSEALILFLNNWRGESSNFMGRVAELSFAMAEKGFWKPEEATTTVAWLDDLIKIGYVPAKLVDWEHKPESSINTVTTTKFPVQDSNCQWRDVGVKISAIARNKPIVSYLLDSFALNFACFPEIKLIVPEADAVFYQEFLNLELTHLAKYVQVVVDVMPPKMVASTYQYKAQWSGKQQLKIQNQYFYGDEYFKDKSLIAYFDSDTMTTAPMTCQSYFDEMGKPLMFYRAAGLQTPWPATSMEVLIKAKENFPEKYRYTVDQVKSLAGTDFMMMFPIIYPREVLILGRQVVMDAFKTQNLEDAFLQWRDPSQFDFYGKLCYLLFQELVKVVAVKATNNVEFDHYARHWQFMTGHVKWPHQGVQDSQVEPPRHENSPEYQAYIKKAAIRSYCARNPNENNFNDFNISDLFKNLNFDLKSAENHCDTASSRMAINEINTWGYAYNRNAIPHDDKAILTYFMEKQPGRKLCNEPYPSQLLRYKKLVYNDVQTDLIIRHDGY